MTGPKPGVLIGDAALTKVINARVTEKDHALIEEASRKAGFPSIGKWLRVLAMREAERLTGGDPS
jgi:hypothetical protein